MGLGCRFGSFVEGESLAAVIIQKLEMRQKVMMVIGN